MSQGTVEGECWVHGSSLEYSTFLFSIHLKFSLIKTAHPHPHPHPHTHTPAILHISFYTPSEQADFFSNLLVFLLVLCLTCA